MNTQTSTRMDLRWQIRFSTSCLHAAAAMARGQLITDMRIAEAIASPAQDLRRAIVAAHLPQTTFWHHLIGLSATIECNRDLAQLALVKTVGTGRAESLVGVISGLISDTESAVRRAVPDMLDELALRVRPLREQWEAHGPGLLHAISRWTDPRAIASEAIVVLVHPSLGGGGAAHLPCNSVHIEGMLANPAPELPEVLRLGWLLAQLNMDLPMFGDVVNAKRLPHIAELAMLPVILQAAEELRLVSANDATIDLALNTWRVITPPDIDPVEILRLWWGTYLETRPRWHVALAALDRMIG